MIEEAVAAGAALSAFSPEAQHDRLLRIHFPREDGPSATLLVNCLVAKEEISRCFHFDVELLSDDARIPLKPLIGRMVTISLVRQDGSLRYFNGYVTRFSFIRADGGFAFYRMVLEPWLALTRLRGDCACFQQLTVIELSTRIFQHYLQRDSTFSLRRDHARHACLNQFNESDYNHLHRRWEAAGIHYFYEHRADGHTLHLSDTSLLARSIERASHEDGVSSIWFAGTDGVIERDGIQRWEAIRQVDSAGLTLLSVDYKSPRTISGLQMTYNEKDEGWVRVHELREYAGAHAFNSPMTGRARARIRMEAMDGQAQHFLAGGNDRRTEPRRTFKLKGHFSAEFSWANSSRSQEIAQREYLIVSVTHRASNNYQAGDKALSHYENEFECVRSRRPWQPSPNHNSLPSRDPGTQTATVVAPAGEEIYTDEYGRVKVQFHWDRQSREDGNNSAWVRVMTPAAGPQYGHVRLPRNGDEVVIQFLDGNVDHPIIIGAVANGENPSPWKLPEQRSLQGIRSRELQGTRGNQLVFDDTNGKIQAQLRSDHLASQLSLGYITRIEGHAGRRESRGEGWELRTDGHGVVRAARGMVITTERRSDGANAVKDMDETVHRLVSAVDQHQQMAQLAKDNQAHDDVANQTEVGSQLKRQLDGIEGGGKSDELKSPHLIFASPAGVASTTSGNTHISSDQHTALSSGKNTSIVSGASFLCSVRQAVRLFAYKAGMKLVAAAGDIELKALTDNIKLLAKLEITQTANRITISAKEEVVINGGGSYAKFAAGSIEMGTTGSFVAHAANHSLPGGKSVEMSHAMPPIAKSVMKGRGGVSCRLSWSSNRHARLRHTFYLVPGRCRDRNRARR